MEKLFNVGKIVNTQGIKGELRIISSTDFKEERFQPGNKLLIVNGNTNEILEVTVKSHREHKNFDIVQFEEFNNINQVEKFKGCTVKVHESQLSELDEDEFYFHEIIGCKVITIQGEELGIIKEILTPGANDVWVVKGDKGKEILIPYIEDVVKEIDINNKIIKIDVLEGLI
jgi:16S rRNA processing protein RimM